MNLDFEPTDVPAVMYFRRNFAKWWLYWYRKGIEERAFEWWNDGPEIKIPPSPEQGEWVVQPIRED